MRCVRRWFFALHSVRYANLGERHLRAPRGGHVSSHRNSQSRGAASERNNGWSTTDPSDLIALHLEDSLFGLGTGNLLSTAATVSAALLSLDGSNLDVGSLAISFLTIIPSDPLDPTIDQFLSFLFGVHAGQISSVLRR